MAPIHTWRGLGDCYVTRCAAYLIAPVDDKRRRWTLHARVEPETGYLPGWSDPIGEPGPKGVKQREAVEHQISGDDPPPAPSSTSERRRAPVTVQTVDPDDDRDATCAWCGVRYHSTDKGADRLLCSRSCLETMEDVIQESRRLRLGLARVRTSPRVTEQTAAGG